MADINDNLLHTLDGPAPQYKLDGLEKMHFAEGDNQGNQYFKDRAAIAKLDALKATIEAQESKTKDVNISSGLPSDYPDAASLAELQNAVAKLGQNQQTLTDVLAALQGTLNMQVTGSNVELSVKNKSLVQTPVGFRWSKYPLLDKIYSDIQRNIFANFDVANLQPTGKTYYVDYINGNDANDGLTKTTAFKNPRTAIEQVDVDVIMLAGGVYPRTHVFQTQSDYTRSISIKGIEGERVVLTAQEPSENFTWTRNSTYQNVYESPFVAGATWVYYDANLTDIQNDYEKLIEKLSISEVDATPGSYYLDNTNYILYVHLVGNKAPQGNLKVFANTPIFEMTSGADIDIYLEGMEYEGGRALVDVRNTVNGIPNLYMKHCKMRYGNGNADGGLVVKGVKQTICQHVESAMNANDGLNYHALNGIAPNVIEIGCIGRDNGESSNTDNGSTIHDGGKIIRVNGKYFRNKGPNVADVNDGTQSWNIGCIAYGSTAEEGMTPPQNVDFTVASGNAEMWLDKCSGYGSEYSLEVRDIGNKVYVRDSNLSTESINGKKYAY